jgi:hypothetical protein
MSMVLMGQEIMPELFDWEYKSRHIFSIGEYLFSASTAA